MRPLQHPVRLRVSSGQDHPADAELTAEAGEGIRWAATAGVDRGLTVPDQLLRQHPDPLKRAAEPAEHVRRLLREDERPGEDTRPAQLDGHDVAAAGMPVPDRDRFARLPQITLRQLPRPIHGALERAPNQEPGPPLAHVVVEDRLAARVAELARSRTQPLRLDRRLRSQLLADPVLELIELDPTGAAEFRSKSRTTVPLCRRSPFREPFSQTSNPRGTSSRWKQSMSAYEASLNLCDTRIGTCDQLRSSSASRQVCTRISTGVEKVSSSDKRAICEASMFVSLSSVDLLVVRLHQSSFGGRALRVDRAQDTTSCTDSRPLGLRLRRPH